MEKMEVCSVHSVNNPEFTKEKYISARTNQIIVCIGIFAGSVWSGMAEDCARAVAITLDEQTFSLIVENFRSWVIPAGILCSYLLMKTWGRKKCLLMANIISFFACICLLFNQQTEAVLVGCMLIWFSKSAYLTTVRVYASEIASPQLRGYLGILICLATDLGWIMNLLFRMPAVGRYGVRACFSMSLISLILTTYNKESPYWLYNQGKTDKVKEAFLWIRGGDRNSEKELSILLAGERNPKASIFTIQFVNAFVIVASLMLVKTVSNIHIINEWDMNILQTNFSADSIICSIVLHSLRIVSSAILCVLILKVRRRILFFISAAGTLISLFSWSYEKSFEPFSEIDLLPLVIFRNIFLFMGASQIPWLLATEIFANHSRDFGFCCSCLLLILFMNFINCEETILSYWLHTTLMLFSSIAAYFIMPETLNITLWAAENKISSKLLKNFRI